MFVLNKRSMKSLESYRMYRGAYKLGFGWGVCSPGSRRGRRGRLLMLAHFCSRQKIELCRTEQMVHKIHTKMIQTDRRTQKQPSIWVVVSSFGENGDFVKIRTISQTSTFSHSFLPFMARQDLQMFSKRNANIINTFSLLRKCSTGVSGVGDGFFWPLPGKIFRLFCKKSTRSCDCHLPNIFFPWCYERQPPYQYIEQIKSLPSLCIFARQLGFHRISETTFSDDLQKLLNKSLWHTYNNLKTR